MTERPSDVRDRLAFGADVPDGDDAIATRGDPGALAGPRRRRRIRSVILVFATAILAGGALSAVPRPVREVTQMVSVPGVPRKPPVSMRLEETSRGFPLRTWILQRGPSDEAVQTYAHFVVKPLAVVLNMLIVAVVGLLALFRWESRRRAE